MNLVDFFGKFHPLVVHLPVGVLSLFLVLGIFISRQELVKSINIIRLMLLFSALTATASTLTGFILYWSGSYEGSLVTAHQILGISLTVINWVILVKLNYLMISRIVIYRITLALVLIVMLLTGHAGGSLTHGAEFLVPPAPGEWFGSDKSTAKEISLNSTAYETASIIIQEKCQVCHGPNKQKGKLRLDRPTFIREGGKHGEIITDDVTKSLLVQRILLPEDDDEHMPPKDRKQLSQDEIDFLIWWIASGADFDLTLQQMGLPDSLQGILTKNESNSFIPNQVVDKANEDVINQLRSLGVIITPLASNTHYLSASFVNVLRENTEAAAEQLTGVNEQLIELDLAFQQFEVSSWQLIGSLTNLRILDLKNSNINDETLLHLEPLMPLVSLNLVGTNITATGLKNIELPALQRLYLYQTLVQPQEFQDVKKIFPGALIDTGNYQVPVLASDTTVFTLH